MANDTESKINVLSLFDGMSCGQIALNRAGVSYKNYFASEIDKAAIKVTLANFPKTTQLGDVKNVEGWELPKIDLLIGGSPCQGFSSIGKQLNFEDPRSKLFFEFVRLRKELNPKFFLLENVKMKKESEQIISEFLGVEPIEINSNLVSAQNRKRLYWTNIPNVSLPKDKKIVIDSIIQKEIIEDAGESFHKWFEKNGEKRIKKGFINIMNLKPKASCLTARQVANWGGNIYRLQNGRFRFLTVVEAERLQTVPDFYTSKASKTEAYKMLGNGWTVDVVTHIFKALKKEMKVK